MRELSEKLPRTFKRAHCGMPLEEMPIPHYPHSEIPRPLHVFQCQVCKIRAFAFPAPVTPLVVWSDEWRHQYPFTEFLARKMESHERKHQVRSRLYVGTKKEPRTKKRRR